MGRSCYCCEKCYKKIIVIAIYDESDPIYCGSNTGVYDNDVFEWNSLIDYHSECSHDIIAGLMVPINLDFDGCISAPGRPLPKDTDNDEWLIGRYPPSSPRLTTSQIVNFFNSLVNRSQDSNFIPELLVFVLDDSGSIRVSQYAQELQNAKIEIQSEYPNLIILQDVSSVDERWIRDSKRAVNNRLCLCECDSNCFRSLFDLPRDGFEGISSFPQEAQNHSVEKVKINFTGFDDWSYNGSYSGLFSNVYQGFDSNDTNLFSSFGNATVNFNINVSNLSIFNREYVFNKQNRICRECCDTRYSSIRVDRYPCIYSIEEEYLGDIDVSFKIELSNISGTAYARNLRPVFLAQTYQLPPEPPYNGREACEWTNIGGSCQGVTAAVPRISRFSQGDITSELTGSLFINYKFSVFVQAKDKLMNLVTSCNQPSNSGSRLSFAWILKETKYETSGVYDNLGLILEGQDVDCDCHPYICSNNLLIQDAACLITNCEKKITNKYSDCRSIFRRGSSVEGIFSDRYQKFVETFNSDIRVKCKIAHPVKHSNIKVRSPFPRLAHGLPSICYLDLIGPPPPDATWKCDEYNDGFFMDFSSVGIPDYEWNDASKTMTTEYLACATNFSYPIINFSRGFLIPSNQYVNTSYSSETNSCFVGYNNKCNNSNNTGFLVDNFWSNSLGANFILDYIMNIKQGRNIPLQNYCDDYTEDKVGVFNFTGIGSFPSLPFSNAIVPVPSVMYGAWVDNTPTFQFLYNPNFQMFQESNDFSRIFSTNNWRAVTPIATSVVANTPYPKAIDPSFILSKPLEINVRVEYE